MPKRPLHILLVEDDDVDAEFILRGFQQDSDRWIITIARNGLEALDLLRGVLAGVRLVQPYIILTDINMPGMNGLEFLRELRRDPELQRSVVFVLTGSALDVDMLAAYDHQIAGYILKASLATDFPRLLHLVGSYQKIVEFPF